MSLALRLRSVSVRFVADHKSIFVPIFRSAAVGVTHWAASTFTFGAASAVAMADAVTVCPSWILWRHQHLCFDVAVIDPRGGLARCCDLLLLLTEN